MKPDGTEQKTEEVEEEPQGDGQGLLSRIVTRTRKIFRRNVGPDGEEYVTEEVVVDAVADTKQSLDRLASTEDFLASQKSYWDARPDPKTVSQGQQYPSISTSPEAPSPAPRSAAKSNKKKEKKQAEPIPVPPERLKKTTETEQRRGVPSGHTSRDGSESPSLVTRIVTKTKKIFQTKTGPDGKEIVVEVEVPEETVTSTTVTTTTTVSKKQPEENPEPKKVPKDKTSSKDTKTSKDWKSKSSEPTEKPDLERLKTTEEFLQGEKEYWAARPDPDQPIAKAEESPKKSKQEKAKKSASPEPKEPKEKEPKGKDESASLLKRIKRTKIIVRKSRGPDGKVHETQEVVEEDVPHDEAAPAKKTRKLITITVNEDGTQTKTEEEIDVPAEGKGDPWATKIVIRKVKVVRKTIKPDGTHNVEEEEREEPVHVLEKDAESVKSTTPRKTVYIEVNAVQFFSTVQNFILLFFTELRIKLAYQLRKVAITLLICLFRHLC